ncbi:MAG TPA: zinc ABC transporter substrate-binding protein [Deltaproteobacteria bacterium]|nr:zinc ABC transporter substrate-binding protein [Deltaproteobacteria bacterium]
MIVQGGQTRIRLAFTGFATLLPMTLLFLAVPASADCAAPDRIGVFVSVLPQAYFVERIGGDRVTVEVLVGPGQSPHTFEPTPRQMTKLAQARVFFRIGVPFENALLPKISKSFQGLSIVDTREGVELLPLAGHDDHVTHGVRHHAQGEGPADPHIWLDPARVKVQARTICTALVRMDPANRGRYEKNLDAFLADLDRLHGELGKILAPLKGSRIYVFHPAFGYLAEAYGFVQVPVELGGKEPSARQLARIVRQARSEGVRVIFVQPQFSRKNAQAVAREIGGTVVPIDPLPREYMAEMRNMADTIRSARLRDEGRGTATRRH